MLQEHRWLQFCRDFVNSNNVKNKHASDRFIRSEVFLIENYSHPCYSPTIGGSLFNDEPPTTKMNSLLGKIRKMNPLRAKNSSSMNPLILYYYTDNTYATICQYKVESVAESEKNKNAENPDKSLQNRAYLGITR